MKDKIVTETGLTKLKLEVVKEFNVPRGGDVKLTVDSSFVKTSIVLTKRQVKRLIFELEDILTNNDE